MIKKLTYILLVVFTFFLVLPTVSVLFDLSDTQETCFLLDEEEESSEKELSFEELVKIDKIVNEMNFNKVCLFLKHKFTLEVLLTEDVYLSMHLPPPECV